MERTNTVVAGPTVRVGPTTVTPLARVRRIAIAGPGFGLFRASVRPEAIEVKTDDGFSQVVGLADPRRWLRLAGLAALVITLMRRKR